MVGGYPTPLLLAGPTAVGKSEVALYLAERIGGEIVSVDSMQVYRGLDVGTAKPSSAERTRVPHHLLDVVPLTERFDAAQFVRLASAAIGEIQAREATPILCGGTGLYFTALLEGIGESPPANPGLRAELESLPIDVLLAELQAKDALTFERIDRQNPRRVVRAVEVIRLTGKPFSAQRAEWNRVKDVPFYCFQRQQADLHGRIDARVDAMFSRGLVDETRRAMEEGLEQNRSAMQAIGYRQVVDFLNGKATLKDTVELVKVRTRQYAKRQLTWFRRQPVTWIQLAPSTTAESIVASLTR